MFEYDKRLSVLEKMSHGITDGDIKQGRAHRAGDTKSARTRSTDPQKDRDLDLMFSIARSRAASVGL